MSRSPDDISATPTGLKKVGDARLEITWADGHVSDYPAHYLRQHCPCAGCVDEWTGERRMAPGTIPVDLKMLSVEIVGQYALTFTWGDGHRTGIYSFKTLRALCPCDQCQAQALASA
jgi:DUF971 family protein